ncbi:MAG: hypothetical protein AAF548_06030 [Actinomycetota bacterium]
MSGVSDGAASRRNGGNARQNTISAPTSTIGSTMVWATTPRV